MIRIVAAAVLLGALSSVPLQAKLMTLTDAERLAVSSSYATRLNALEERSKEWEKRKTIAGYLPSVTYSLNYLMMDETTVDNANAGYDGMIAGINALLVNGGLPAMNAENMNTLYPNSFSHEIAVSQPLTNGGAEYFAIKIAGHTKEAVELQQQAAIQQAVHDVRKAYFDAVSAVERTTVAEQALEWVQLNLRSAQSRHEAGTVPYTDVLQWEAEEAGKMSEIAAAEATEQLLKLTLQLAFGQNISENTSLIELEPFDVFSGRTDTEIAVMDGTSENGLQLRSIQAYTKAAKGYKDLSVSSFLPSLNAFYNLSWPAHDKLAPNTDRKGWTAGIAASVPLFTSFKNYSGYKQAAFSYEKTVLETEQVEEGMRLNLERIKLFHHAAGEGLKAALKQYELMEKQLDLMQQRYDGGLVNQSVLLEIGLAKEQTRIGYVHKLFEYLLLESEYQLAVGELEAK